MKNKKRILTLLMVASMITVVFTACGDKEEKKKSDRNSNSEFVENTEEENDAKKDDCQAMIDMITMASTVAADISYDVVPDHTFVITIKDGTAEFKATDSEATKGWTSVLSNGSTYNMTSVEFSKISVTYTGVVQSNGSITWTADGDKSMLDYSKNLADNFE